MCKNRSRAIEVNRLDNNYMKEDHRNYRRNFLVTGRYRRGQGFESCTSLNFFRLSFRTTAKIASISAMVFFRIVLHPAVLINDFHVFITPSSYFRGFNTNQFNDLLPVGLLAQLVRALHRYHRGEGFESRKSLNFFRPSVRNCKSCVYNCDDPPSCNSSPRSCHI